MTRTSWSDEQDAFLREIFPSNSNAEVARLMNEKFGTDRTQYSVMHHARKLGVRKPPDYSKPQPRKFWTDEKREWFVSFVPGHHEYEISAEHERLYGTPLTEGQIGNMKHILGVKSGTDGGRLRKGNVPWNKGKTWDELGIPHESRERCAATQFKPGEVHISPSRERPIGYERVDKDGFTWVKVRDSRIDGIQRQAVGHHNENYKMKHHIVYEREYGPVPKGCSVVFADHDKSNFEPSNLVAVPRSLWSVISHEKWAYHDRESLEVCVNLARLSRVVYRARCHPRECKQCGCEFVPRFPNQRTCDGCLGR